MLVKSKQIIISIITIIFIAIILNSAVFTSEAKKHNISDMASDNMWFDKDGNLHYTSTDKDKTSDTYYKTFGVEVSAVDSNGDYETGVAFTIDDEHKGGDPTSNGDGTTTYTYTWKASEVKAALTKQYGENIADQIMSGQTKAVANSVIAVHTPNGWTNQTLMGTKGSNEQGYYTIDNLDALLSSFGWPQSVINSILTHFNKLLNIDAEAAEEYLTSLVPPTTTDDDPPIDKDDKYSSGFNAICEYGHTSGEYDLSKGIPSGESLQAHANGDKWYGDYTYARRKGSYNFTNTCTVYWWYWKTEATTTTDENGNTTTTYTQVRQDASYVFEYKDINREYIFYYNYKLNLYQLKDVVLANGSYGSTTFDINYGLSYKATSNGGSFSENGDANSPAVNPTTPGAKTVHMITPNPVAASVDIGYSALGVTAADKQKYRSYAEDGVPEYQVANDYLEINGKVLMDNGTGGNGGEPTYSEKEAPAPSGISDSMRVTFDEEKSVSIPKNKENKKYSTTQKDFNYEKICPSSETGTVTQTGTLKSDMHDNIVVHTPVISPVSISGVDNNNVKVTQLTAPLEYLGDLKDEWKNLDEKYYLLLDHTYTIKYDAYKWLQRAVGEDSSWRDILGYGDSGDPSKYNKYINKKVVSFPFDVSVKDSSGNWKFYSADQTPSSNSADGDTRDRNVKWTEWIVIDNDASSFEFYIPSWAEESTSAFPIKKTSGTVYDYYKIAFRVEAQNVIDYDNNTTYYDHTEDTENSIWNNPSDDPVDESSYVATYEVAVNLSGIVYDFQIVGSTNKDIYTTESNGDDWEDQSIAFSSLKEEKRSGTLNRLGENAVRYNYDGEITTSWDPLNTIALSKGSSTAYSDMGGLWQGQTFSFLVRTIANLDDPEDYMEITPSFRYVDANGNETDSSKLQLYYNTSDGRNFVRLGSDEDTNSATLQSVQLGSKMFDGSYYNGSSASHGYDDLSYTSNKFYGSGNLFGNPIANDTNYYYLNKQVESYSFSYIKLSDTLKLLTGNLERLGANLDKSPSSVKSLTQLYGSTSEIGTTEDVETLLQDSMQTWFGQYSIPEELYIVPEIPDNVTDQDSDGDIDLDDYVIQNGGKLSEDDEIFATDGYLVLNFDITTTNDNKSHLSYSGGNGGNAESMWDTEGRRETVYTGGDPNIEIKTQPGDVAIVEIGNKVSDKYSNRILFID